MAKSLLQTIAYLLKVVLCGRMSDVRVCGVWGVVETEQPESLRLVLAEAGVVVVERAFRDVALLRLQETVATWGGWQRNTLVRTEHVSENGTR